MAKKKSNVLELPVAFGNVNIGDETARVAITVSRGNLTVSQADRHLCGKRLSGTIKARAAGVAADQGSLPGVAPDFDAELTGTFDVNGFKANTKHIGTGLTFLLNSIDVTNLARFAKREGMFEVHEIGDIPEPEKKGEEEDDG